MGDLSNRRKSKYNLRNQALDDLTTAEKEIADNQERKMLKRELRKQALSRIENAARTPADFEKLSNTWDLIDSNRERKERYHETDSFHRMYKRDNDGAEMEMNITPYFSGAIPIPFRFTLRTRYWRQVIAGNFLDYIFDCKFWLHEMTSRKDLSEALNSLTDNQKEIFYMIAIEGKTSQQIAEYRGQTDRNIRKVYNMAIASIHKKLNQK